MFNLNKAQVAVWRLEQTVWCLTHDTEVSHWSESEFCSNDDDSVPESDSAVTLFMSDSDPSDCDWI